MNEKSSADNRVLIVDDEPVIQRLWAKYTRDAGWKPTVAEDGLEALALAKSNDYELILTDYQMPEMDGIELCRHLRQEQRTIHTPIILCSAALADLDTTELQQELGAIQFVPKPMKSAELAGLLRTFATSTI